VENLNEVYVYIYYRETGAVDKHFIATHDDLNEETLTQEWMPYVYAVDNLLIVKTGKTLACIETSSINSIILDSFRYEDDFDNDDEISIDFRYNSWLLSYKNKTFFIASHSGDRLDIQAFKESMTAFSGYISFSYSRGSDWYSTRVYTTSDEVPYITQDGWAARRWTGAY